MAAAAPPSSPTEDPAPAGAGAVLARGSCIPKACEHLGLPRHRLLVRAKATCCGYLEVSTILAWVFPIPRMGRVVVLLVRPRFGAD